MVRRPGPGPCFGATIRWRRDRAADRRLGFRPTGGFSGDQEMAELEPELELESTPV